MWTVSHPDKGTHEVTEEVALVLRNRPGWTITNAETAEQADTGQEDNDGMPDKAEDLIDWIGTDPDRARTASDAEQARPKPRTTVTDHITKVLDTNTDTPEQADTGQEE